MQSQRLAKMRQLTYRETNPALKAQYALAYAAELEREVGRVRKAYDPVISQKLLKYEQEATELAGKVGQVKVDDPDVQQSITDAEAALDQAVGHLANAIADLKANRFKAAGGGVRKAANTSPVSQKLLAIQSSLDDLDNQLGALYQRNSGTLPEEVAPLFAEAASAIHQASDKVFSINAFFGRQRSVGRMREQGYTGEKMPWAKAQRGGRLNKAKAAPIKSLKELVSLAMNSDQEPLTPKLMATSPGLVRDADNFNGDDWKLLEAVEAGLTPDLEDDIGRANVGRVLDFVTELKNARVDVGPAYQALKNYWRMRSQAGY